jgi:hypothetical protein
MGIVFIVIGTLAAVIAGIMGASSFAASAVQQAVVSLYFVVSMLGFILALGFVVHRLAPIEHIAKWESKAVRSGHSDDKLGAF